MKKALSAEQLEVKAEKLKDASVASMITVSEETRRMQDMMKMYGMDNSMFGEKGETLVLNVNHPLVKYVVDHGDGEQTADICEQLYDLAELFKIFGDSTRVKILYALLEAELCVCDIAKLMDVSQSAVSHQLRVLKGSKLVKFRREGKTLYYSLADEHVFRILSQGMEHILEGPETP